MPTHVKTKNRPFFLYAVAAALVIGWLILIQAILPAGPTNEWDQNVHALHGLNLAYNLQQGDWLKFFFDTYRQVYYPFLHSWILAFAILIAGPSLVTARAVSLVFFIAMSLLLYLAARQMRKRHSELAGIIVATLTLTSPAIVRHSTLCMLETTGLFAVSLTIFTYFRLENKNGPAHNHMLLGLCMTIAYFVKINYGVLLFMAFMLTRIIEIRFRFRLLLTRANFFTIFPMVIIFAIWFAYPPKILSTWRALVSVPWGVENAYSFEGFLFYPRTVIKLSGSFWLFALFLGSFISAFNYRKNKKILFLLVLIVTQLAIAQLHTNKADRHLFTILPPLFLLTANTVTHFWARFNVGSNKAWSWGCVLLLCLLFIHAFSVLALSWPRPPRPYNDEVTNYVASEVRKTGRTIILGSIELRQPYPPLLDWQLINSQKLITPPLAGILSAREEIRKLATILKRMKAPSEISDFLLQALSRDTQKGMTRTVYLGVYPYNVNAKDDITIYFKKIFNIDQIDGILVLTSLHPKARFPFSFIHSGLKNTSLKHLSTQRIHNTRIDMFKRIEVMIH